MMPTRRVVGTRATTVAASVAIALLVAACGGGGSSSTKSGSKQSAPPPATSSGSAPSSGGVTVATAKGPMGTYLTDSSGQALYLWVADSNGKSSCSGSCAQAWRPLTAAGTVKATGAVKAADLGTTTRSDGSKQVTYDGHPLYTFVQDSGAGSTNGEGSSQFGAKWWLVAPSGKGITKTSAASSSSSSSGGSSGGGSASGWG